MPDNAVLLHMAFSQGIYSSGMLHNVCW